jgi:hypothetical protein
LLLTHQMRKFTEEFSCTSTQETTREMPEDHGNLPHILPSILAHRIF